MVYVGTGGIHKMSEQNNEQNPVEKDVKDAVNVVTNMENDEKNINIPDKVVVKVGDDKVTVNTDNLDSTVKSALPWVIIVLWYLLVAICAQFNWKIPFTNEDFTQIVTVIVSAVITLGSLHINSPLTQSGKLKKAVGQGAATLIKDNAEDTTQEIKKVEPAEVHTTILPDKE